MITLFRRIRQKLIDSGNITKYLLYAIGEILLVVIGILIALQINNWNEYKIERAMEMDLLVQLKSEYESNLEQLDEKIDMRSNIIDASVKLLAYIDAPETSNEDSVYTFLGETFLVPTFDPIVNDIISSGRIQLIQNTELRTILTRWTSDVVQITEEEKSWYDFNTFVYGPTVTENISYRNVGRKSLQTASFSIFQLDGKVENYLDIGESKLQTGINDLLTDPDFESHIVTCLYLITLTNSQSMSLRQRIVDILDLIESEIGTI